jgi:hypothetical protein
MTESNDVVINDDTISFVIDGLYRQPDLFYSLQFSSLVEQMILSDSIIVVVSDDSAQRATESHESSIARDILDLWARSGVISYKTVSSESLERTRSSDPYAIEIDASTLDKSQIRNVNENPLFEMAWEAMEALHSERHLGVPSAVPPLHLLFYEVSANVRGDHSVCDLAGHYSDLAAMLMALRRDVQVAPQPYVAVPLPPLGYEVFRRTRSIDEIFDIVLDVREQYSDLRTRLRELADVFNDPTVPQKHKLLKRMKWEAAWRSLEKKYTFSGRMEVASTTQALYKAAPDIPGAIALNPNSWLSLLATIHEQIPDLWQRWRFRALHRTLDGYLQAPDRNLGSAIEKVIRRPIDDGEAAEIEGLVNDIKRLYGDRVIATLRSDLTAPPGG